MIGYEIGPLKLKGKLLRRTDVLFQISGIVLILLIWYILTMGEEPILRTAILPTPGATLRAFGELFRTDDLLTNLLKSIGLNLAGYVEAILLGLIGGFLIGLYPMFRSLFQRPVDALRFVPLTALTGMFIIWFGLGASMKVHFLAFGIFIYLLPVVVQRVDEVSAVYLKTAYTLGATNFQMIRTIILPHVMSRLIDDIRVLTAISWTYIIIAEMLGNEGGVGALLWRAGQRQGRVDKVFAMVLLIIVIGVIQDRLFKEIDRHFFPHKYSTSRVPETKPKAHQLILSFIGVAIGWIALGIGLLLVVDSYTGLPFGFDLMEEFFGGTKHVMSAIILCLAAYVGFYHLYLKPRRLWTSSKA